MSKKIFSSILCILLCISLFSGCSISADKLTSKAVSSQAVDEHLYPAYKMLNNMPKWGYINSDGKFRSEEHTSELQSQR